MVDFTKQPVSPPPGSDSEAVSDGHDQPRPLSLLSSMLSDHAPRLAVNGYTSASSSTPSTTFSSPRAHDPVSILRRGSIGSDAEPFHLPMAAILPKVPLPSSPEKPELVHSNRALKFAVANHREPERPVPPARDELLDAEGNSTDPGYVEDSEDGFSDDDEPAFMLQAHKEAMERARTRAVQASAQTRSLSMSPRPASPTRGRGHVRVDSAAGHDHESCSRHCSPPPPSDSRSSRSAPPGPREGRAGSPAPSKHDSDDDEEEEEDEEEVEEGDEEEEDADHNKHTAKEEPDGAPDESAVIDDDCSEDAPASAASLGDGVRKILRRASEHLPSFRRPSFALTPVDGTDGGSPSLETECAGPGLGRAKSLGSRAVSAPMRATVSADGAVARSRPMACPGRRES